MLTTIVYDGSFMGFLTTVFEVYEYKLQHVDIVTEGAYNISVFQQQHKVFTNEQKAKRVHKGLLKHISKNAVKSLYDAFLSEMPGIEKILLRYIQYAFANTQSVETDFSNEAVLTVSKTAKKVHREKHRMEAFVRFQLTKDGLYYAVIQPDFNVLPLISNHFEKRYADQRWMIYDVKRKYGLYYDLKSITTANITFTSEAQNVKAIHQVYDENEMLYQSLWQRYFSSINIKARKNTRLHIQHMPKRYWRYLTEKQ